MTHSGPFPPAAPRTFPRRTGFTIVEGLIAVALIALLAATVLPQLGAAGAKSEGERLREQLHVLRGQIELYRVQHRNVLPGVTGPFLEQLTRRTNVGGESGEGPEYPFGPYLIGETFPENPLTGRAGVAVVEGDLPPTDPADGAHGWIYSAATGELRARGDAERYAW